MNKNDENINQTMVKLGYAATGVTSITPYRGLTSLA